MDDIQKKTASVGSLFKKRSIKNQRGRKRRNISGSDKSSSEDETTVFKKEKKVPRNNPLYQSTAIIAKQKVDNEVSGESSNDDNESSVTVSYKSRRDTTPYLPTDQGATACLEIETPVDRDAQAIYENSIKINKELKGKEDDKVYRGLANYTQFYEKRDTAQGNAASGMVRKGPIRAPSNLRATVRWDYQPDICKDYKETGFCGFGDSCKFLHDRTDYKHGWQLEREAGEQGGCGKQGGGPGSGEDSDTNYEIHSDDDHLPFKCFICRQSFTDPIQTKCGHYFCEKCALKQYKKSTRCYICNVQTNGVFNPAKNIIAKMQSTAVGGGQPSDSDHGDSD